MEVKKSPDELKAKIFEIAQKQQMDVNILKIQSQKVKLKNTLVNNSFNILFKKSEHDENGLESTDYKKLENIYDTLLQVKKSNPNKANSFNLAIKPLQIGEILPLKIIRFNNEIYQLPRNKINILMFISRNFNFHNKKISNFLEFMNNKFVSSLHISLYKTLNEGLLEYSPDFLSIKRQLNISNLPFAIVYDSKLRTMWKGDLNDLMEDETLKLILKNDMQKVVSPDGDILNLPGQLSHLKITNDNQNIISEDQKNEYIKLKSELRKLNRNCMREMKCKLEQVEIKLTNLKKYQIRNNKKTIYKPHIDYNEKATIKDKTGKYIDNLIMNYKPIMNFLHHENEIDYQKYIKYTIDYLYTSILIPLQLVGKVKLGIKLEEKLGLCNRKMKYTIYNITPFFEILDMSLYYDVVLKAVDEYILDYKNKQLNDLIDIKTHFYPVKSSRMKVPCYDEDIKEKQLDIVEGEVHILNIINTFNSLLLNMLSSNLPLIETIKRTTPKGKKLPKINTVFGIICPYFDIEIIKSTKEYKELKQYIKGNENSQIVFVDVDTQLIDWMEYSLGEEVGSAIITTPKGEKIYLSTDDFILMDDILKIILNGTKTYTIEKTTYEELRDFGKKLMKVKLADLDYNPYFYYQLVHLSEVETNIEKSFQPKDLKFETSFICKLRRKDKASVVPFIRRTKQIMKINEELDIFEELCEVIDIPIGESCSECKKEIKGLNQLHFYCYWCKVHFCSECGNKYHPEKANLIDKQPHQHFLTLIKVQNQTGMKNIDTYKFGNNVWHIFQNPESFMNAYECKCCGENIINEVRYSCLTCRPGSMRGQEEEHLEDTGYTDFCPKCIQIILNDEWKSDPKSIKKFSKENHDCNTHIYLRVDILTGNYFFY